MAGTEKIVALAKELMTECEAQGFSAQAIASKCICMWDFGNGIKIENSLSGWEIGEDGIVTRRETNE